MIDMQKPLSVNRQKAIALRKKYPCMTGSAIAFNLGISRERVRQLLKEDNAHFRQKYICLNCEKEYYPKSKNGNLQFCSKECFMAYHRITLVCFYCEKEFKRLRSQVLSAARYYNSESKIFCSHSCGGKYYNNLKKIPN